MRRDGGRERGVHFICGDDIEAYAASFGRDEEDKHMWVIIELVDCVGPLFEVHSSVETGVGITISNHEIVQHF